MGDLFEKIQLEVEIAKYVQFLRKNISQRYASPLEDIWTEVIPPNERENSYSEISFPYTCAEANEMADALNIKTLFEASLCMQDYMIDTLRLSSIEIFKVPPLQQLIYQHLGSQDSISNQTYLDLLKEVNNSYYGRQLKDLLTKVWIQVITKAPREGPLTAELVSKATQSVLDANIASLPSQNNEFNQWTQEIENWLDLDSKFS